MYNIFDYSEENFKSILENNSNKNYIDTKKYNTNKSVLNDKNFIKETKIIELQNRIKNSVPGNSTFNLLVEELVDLSTEDKHLSFDQKYLIKEEMKKNLLDEMTQSLLDESLSDSDKYKSGAFINNKRTLYDEIREYRTGEHRDLNDNYVFHENTISHKNSSNKSEDKKSKLEIEKKFDGEIEEGVGETLGNIASHIKNNKWKYLAGLGTLGAGYALGRAANVRQNNAFPENTPHGFEPPQTHPIPTPIPNSNKPHTVVVHTGDNLSKIAAKHNTSLKDIITNNPDIKNPNLIYPGQSIKV